MLSRLLSTVILWGVVVGSVWLVGVHAVVALVSLVAALTLHEFYLLAEKLGARPFRTTGIVCSLLMTAGPYYLYQMGFEAEVIASFAPALLALATVAFAVGILGARDNTNRVESLVASMLGLLYVPYMLHYQVRLLLLGHADVPDSPVLFPPLDPGIVYCLWVVIVAKFCDVGALLTGMLIGRHKMSPNISPKKTWEGAVGGVLIAVGLGALVAWWLPDFLPEKLTPVVAIPVALVVAVIAIVSDLIESVFKRRADLKDTGRLIPGIGGAFDLCDSLILTSPVAYCLFLFLE